MSGNKRKRVNSDYNNQVIQIKEDNDTCTIYTQQPLIASLMTTNQVENNNKAFETLQLQLVDGTAPQNPQSNLVYILVPQGVSGVAGIPNATVSTAAVLGSPPKLLQSPPPLLDYQKLNNDQAEDEEDVILVKEPEVDPLQIHQDPLAIYDELQDVSGEQIFIQAPEIDKKDPTRFKMLFKCDYPDCISQFPTLHEKRLHLDVHLYPQNTEYKCNICNMVFENAVDRNRHVSMHTIVDTYKCKACGEGFPYYTSLVKHINEKKCNSCKLYTCNFCGVDFADAKDLGKHQKFNIKVCECRAKICNDRAFEMHTSFCAAYQNDCNKQKNKTVRKKRTNSNEVIILD